MHAWPQYTLLAIMAASFGISLAKFGEPKNDKYDWSDLIIGPALTLTILYCGGFFAPLGF